MNDGVIRITSPADLVEVVPHILGFAPSSSIVVCPVAGQGMPHARVDLPETSNDRVELVGVLARAYGRHAQPGQEVALLCFTEDRRNAELISQQVVGALSAFGIAAPVRIWASDERWMEFNSGEQGFRNADVANRIAAQAVLAGRAGPAATRESLAASLVGDRDPVARELPAVREAVEGSMPTTERNWAMARVDQFLEDGNRLSDPDAARLMLAMSSTRIRDAVMEGMNRQVATSHSALWSDMTRRAPDEVRTPVAGVLAFSSWLEGHGAKAWCALDQIPQGEDYPLASLVGTLLQEAIPPSMWEKAQTAGFNETFTPPPPGRGPNREGPGMGRDQPGPDAPRR